MDRFERSLRLDPARPRIARQADKQVQFMTSIDHEAFMRRCIELAMQAGSNGETPVGSLIVRDGLVISEGLEAVIGSNDGTAHAEINAIRVACATLGGRDLSECTLYSTAEPCVMCSYAIRRAAIQRVVVGSLGSHLGGATSSYSLLTDASIAAWPSPPELIGPVLQDQCARLFVKTPQT